MLILLYIILLFMFGNAVDLPFNEDESAGIFDPKPENFCDNKCTKYDDGNDEEHVACRCNQYRSPESCKPYRTDQLLDFRKLTLTLHNELRNKIASGEETNPNAGKASNMNAVSYDLGLEYVAMCTSMKCVMEHDHCRKMKKFHYTGQNLYISQMSADVFGMENRTRDGVLMWYNELKLMSPEVIEKFAPKEEYGHYTAMVWALMTHIGCAITADTKIPGKKGWLTIMVSCNYGILNDKYEGINMITRPVYKRGAPASACKKGRKPNSLYPALCGEIEPIPVGKLTQHGGPGGSGKGGSVGCYSFNWVVMILVFVIVARF